jgi:hypothetical protein
MEWTTIDPFVIGLSINALNAENIPLLMLV